jgi:hypothetical protein
MTTSPTAVHDRLTWGTVNFCGSHAQARQNSSGSSLVWVEEKLYDEIGARRAHTDSARGRMQRLPPSFPSRKSATIAKQKPTKTQDLLALPEY